MNMKLTLTGLILWTVAVSTPGYAQEISLNYGEPSYSGSGCPQDSVAMGTSPTAFTLLFDSFIAEDGDGVRARENTKVCTVRVPVSVPSGYQIAIDSVDHRGFVSLSDKRAWGVLKTWFRVKGNMWVTNGSSQADYFRGPLDEDYFRRDLVKKHHRQWSPCGGSFHFDVHTYMHVHAARHESALITLDASDGAMSTRYGMEVRRCKK